ncbi:cupredoxin domain-containing protein [Metabacillus iocasae]|uniref:Heme/copper-type cytochrome/quinol oxidase subunit 2 n=1 Tax=Priestia iocasae TaxID=2291674 RepID=A0ABS2QXC7_9BACI|nr:cupredoxin domain-containing protein [Metabacillus iocasae]MBM7704128.1 heme/copper-type cytochrome/quinol oxidase subunit 2 [Metabacillus iocasae]
MKKWMMGLIIAIFIVGCSNDASKEENNQSSATPTGEVKEVTVVGKTGSQPEDFKFEPEELTVNEGDTVKLTLKSEEGAPHGLWIPGLNVKAEDNETTEFVVAQKGEYEGQCSVLCGTGHGMMTFKVIVE